jgi:hypothetical protein
MARFGARESQTVEATVSRYQFREEPQGFLVEGEQRPPVRVTFQPTALEARYVGVDDPAARERFGFFNFGKLLEFVARGLLREWRPLDGWYGARAWAQQQTARAIARRLREQWLRLIDRADPTVLGVQKAIFAATFSDAPLASDARLYQDTFLVRDILNYPAAAIAVRNAWKLTHDLPLRRLHGSAQARALHALARSLGLGVRLQVQGTEDPDQAAQLEALRDWKALFSDTGHDYRSLNRTLMNLPGRLPHRQVCNLRLIHLERPLEHRLEVLGVVFCAAIRANREDWPQRSADHGHVFQHAGVAQVREALRRVAAHLHLELSPRKAGDVRQMVQFLADYPDEHRGSLAGLADRAIRWHQSRQQEQQAAMQRLYGPDALTARPPVAPPEDPRIRFLDTVAAVCAEAEQMRHCVASYLDLAIGGNCYLFHVSYQGEEATIEVGGEGKVRQAQGPRNQPNRAARWGKRVLNRWAASFPQPVYPARRMACPPLEDDVPF